MRSDHHDGQTFIVTFDSLEKIEPGPARQDYIAKNQVRRLTIELALGLGHVRRCPHVIAPVCDAQRQYFAQRWLVVDDENGETCLIHVLCKIDPVPDPCEGPGTGKKLSHFTTAPRSAADDDEELGGLPELLWLLDRQGARDLAVLAARGLREHHILAAEDLILALRQLDRAVLEAIDLGEAGRVELASRHDLAAAEDQE